MKLLNLMEVASEEPFPGDDDPPPASHINIRTTLLIVNLSFEP